MNHIGTEQGPDWKQPHKSLSPVFLAAVIALLLSSGLNGAVLQAQTLSESTNTTDNHPTVKHRARGIQKDEKTALKTSNKSTTLHAAKSAPANSQNQDSQTPFGALSTGNRGPISIQSDSLALDYKQNAVLFSGHVHAAQADGALASNTLHVKYGKDFHEVQDMAADGNVRISQGVRWCTSDHAVMHQQQHLVILTGSPICHDDRDQITGTRITVHLDTGKSDIEGARAVIFPQQAKTRDNETLANQVK